MEKTDRKRPISLNRAGHFTDRAVQADPVLRSTGPPAAAPVEEHLLVCEECRARLAGGDAAIGAMREAMRCFGECDNHSDLWQVHRASGPGNDGYSIPL